MLRFNNNKKRGETTMRNFLLALILISFILLPSILLARDIHVRGHYRKDGTYVRPHVRSSPDGYKSNNYGPSTTSDQLNNPRQRDWDGDGTPNYLDNDDDNDGYFDDNDRQQYNNRQW